MTLQRLAFASAIFAPIAAVAHPGHDASALHLHLGAPAASNSLDLSLTCAALVLGLVFHCIRSAKRR